MATPAPILELSDLALSASLVLVAGVCSVALRLRLEKRLLIASLRTVAQLGVIGYVLGWVFAELRITSLLLLIVVMVGAAAHAAIRRPKREYKGAGWRSLLSLSVSSLLTCVVVTAAIVRPQPWYLPQTFIPLLGMILGNSLTGISLCLDSLLQDLVEKRARIEMELSLGATRWEAARGLVSSAVERGMIPILNSMTVVGLVSLPGMMTGQILGGADPHQAVRYQIVVMFMLCASTALGSMGIAMLTFRRCFTARHQLDAESIRER